MPSLKHLEDGGGMPHSTTTTVILITGHPAAGKTTLARRLGAALQWPTFCKDDGKELLFDTLGMGDYEWSNRLGMASFELLYYQSSVLLQASISHIIEANFAPRDANKSWQQLQQAYGFRCIQVLCFADPEEVMRRYNQRIQDGNRHAGHVDESATEKLRKRVLTGHTEWIEVNGKRIPFDTTEIDDSQIDAIIMQVKELL